MRRLVCAAAVVLLAHALPAAYTRTRTSAGLALNLRSPRVQLTLNNAIPSASNILPGSDPISALDAARLEWSQFGASSLNFPPFASSAETMGKNDGINLVSFADASIYSGDTDTLATTVIIFRPSTGEVLDTDVLFNPNIKFFTVPGTQGFDIQSVATHEFGHAVTADHTAVQSATMFQSSSELEFFQRTLDADDLSFLFSTYPAAGRTFGSISGRVVTGSGGGIFGAHVVAYDASRNAVASGVSLADGSYSLDGLPAGNYQIYAEPFDGPVTPSSLLSGNTGGFLGSANTTFVTSAPVARVLADSQRIENLVLTAGSGSVRLNLTRAGRNFTRPTNSAGSFLVGSGPVLAAPGQSFSLVLLGDGITAAVARDASFRLDIEGGGVFIGRRDSGQFSSGTAFALADVTLSEDAVPGPRQIRIAVGDQISYYTAGLVIAERNPVQSTQSFAAVGQSATQFTGIGLLNLGDTATVVRARFYGQNGQLFAIPGMQNPAFFSIPAGGQLARTTRDIFQAAQDEKGWVELQADQSRVYSFFLTGDASGGRINGSDVPQSALTRGLFTDVRRNATFETEIHVANGNSTPVTVHFSFFGFGGQKLGPVSRTIAPRGSLSETAGTLFPGLGVSDSAYVTFEADQPVTALELVRSATTLVSLNAQDLSSTQTAVAASHFAVGSSGALVYFSRVYLVNPSTTPIQVRVEARDPRGAVLGAPVFSLGPESSLPVEVADSFGLARAGVTIIGSLTAQTLGGGALFGSILFGDGAAGNFASEFPLESIASLGKDLVFEQLATTAGFFTGLSVYNPGTVSAKISVEVRRSTGQQLGSTYEKTLAPNEKLTNQIVELVSGMPSAAANQGGGYIRLRSDQPVAAAVLFGNTAGTVLAAVPASKVAP